MSFIVEDRGSAFERCPPGMHLARCYQIVDLGTQKTEYMGEIKFQHKVRLGWELHGQDDTGSPLQTADGRPFAMYKTYTVSWSERATLRIDLQAWRGRPFTHEEMRRFDLKNVLGAWCMLNVMEKQGTNGVMYTNVQSVAPVPGVVKQNGLPPPINKNELFSFQDPDFALVETFSTNLQTKIKSSPEWMKLEAKGLPKSREPGSDDDKDGPVPF